MTILVVGHYCHDSLLTPEGEHQTLGGAAAYASAVLEALGADYEVVAKVGPDFRYGGRVPKQPRIVQSARTSSFVDDYRFGERREWLEASCEPILPDDLSGSFAAGIACGVSAEIPAATLARIRALSRITLADAQSLLRSFGPHGEVVLQRLDPDAAAQLDWLKASRSEAEMLDVPHLRATLRGLVVTDGPRGVTLLTGDEELHVPAFPAIERDPTGAGDCFLAGFAWALAEGHDPLRAARFGAYCGARAVEEIGVPRFSRADLLRQIQDVA